MGAQQRLLCEALARLGEARRAMAALAAVSPDWCARARLGAEFDGVAEACREFAECQLGMRLPGADSGPTRNIGQSMKRPESLSFVIFSGRNRSGWVWDGKKNDRVRQETN